MVHRKILVDENLLGLLHWYRFAGVDAAAGKGLSDSAVAEMASREGRLVLTRDRAFAERLGPGKAVLVSGEGRYAQWRAAVRATGLPEADAWFRRCACCNLDLSELNSDQRQAEPGLPPGVRASAATIFRCDGCNRAYWEGSHFRRLRSFLEASLSEEQRRESAVPATERALELFASG